MKTTKASARASRAKLTRHKSPLALAVCGAALLGAALTGGGAQATPGFGVVGEPVTLGSLPEPIRVKLKGESGGFEDGTSVAQIVVIKFTVQPGGYFGWHRHGGPVWVAVAAGTLTLYEADDTTCTGHAYTPGSAFLDYGDHTHNARNEGAFPVVVYGTFLLPAGGAVRVDAPNPNVCAF
jgi:quercetin dioxygenase-like cupin family protein